MTAPCVRPLGALLFIVASLPSAVRAQDRGVAGGWWRSGVVSESWRFKTALPTDSGRVERVNQTTIPFGVAIPLGARWTADLSGAYAIGSARVSDSAGRNAHDLDLNGPTDVKLRVVGRLIGDALIVTAGVNAPTGLTKLAPSEVTALRLIGSPVLRMPSPTLGSGFGATAGVVVARQVGAWAVALGGSYESRSSYSPVDVAAGGAAVVKDLDPSDAAHLTLGGDRLIGNHRLSLLGSYDVYGEDRLTFASSGASSTTATFQLGPTVTVLSLLELGVAGMQELSVSLLDRHRAAFTGIDGNTAAGSSGNSLDARVRARWGTPGRLGYLVGAEGRFDTGLDVDASLATAATTAFGGTIGLSVPLGGVSLEPSLRGIFGSIDTGIVSTNATSISLSVTIGRR